MVIGDRPLRQPQPQLQPPPPPPPRDEPIEQVNNERTQISLKGGGVQSFVFRVMANAFVQRSTMVRVEAGSLEQLIERLVHKTRAEFAQGASVCLVLLPTNGCAVDLISLSQVPLKGKVELRQGQGPPSTPMQGGLEEAEPPESAENISCQGQTTQTTDTRTSPCPSSPTVHERSMGLMSPRNERVASSDDSYEGRSTPQSQPQQQFFSSPSSSTAANQSMMPRPTPRATSRASLHKARTPRQAHVLVHSGVSSAFPSATMVMEKKVPYRAAEMPTVTPTTVTSTANSGAQVELKELLAQGLAAQKAKYELEIARLQKLLAASEARRYNDIVRLYSYQNSSAPDSADDIR
jgi:hypothetical protein